MFKAFFDESGTNPKENKALVVGGFVGRVEEWERASDAWNETLHATPAIDYFSHSEAQTLDLQFLKFNRTEADKKVLALATTISKFRLFGLCASVPYGLFRDRDPKVTRGMMGTRVYDWGFAAATSGALQYLEETVPGNEKIDFVFDERSELRACIDIFDSMKEMPLFSALMIRAGQCIPGDDKEIVALQIADLLAWEFSKAGETSRMSEAFSLIRENNKIGHLPTRPPKQFMPMLRIQRLSNQVRDEAIAFLKKTRNPPENWSPQEILQEVEELKAREAYADAEMGRLLLAMDSDEAYQEFKQRYLAGHNPEEGDDLPG